MVLIETICFLVVAAFLSAQMIYWLWWCFGSPKPVYLDNLDYPLAATAERGRILSHYGLWIAGKFTQYEDKQLQQHIQKGGNLDNYEPLHLNFWKAAGCCIFCFAVWACLPLAVVWYWIAARYLGAILDIWQIFGLFWVFATLTLTALKREMEE